MKCAIGGTFSYLHSGHKKVIASALLHGNVVVGLASDKLAAKLGKGKVPAYAKRQAALEAYLGKVANGRYEIAELKEFAGPAATDAGITHLCGGLEKAEAAARINEVRRRSGLLQLKFVPVHYEYGQDCLRISSSAIAAGKIDGNGRRLAPLVVAVGSQNETKIEGARLALAKVFPRIRVKVAGLKVPSGIAAQPFGHETLLGAKNRAKEAYERAVDADYGVGFESGLFRFEKRLFDIAFCALYDGHTYSLGNSMGFSLPSQIELRVLGGEGEMGEVVSRIAKMEKIGTKGGAISFLSGGILQRREMNEQALCCAFIPRIAARKGIF